MLGSYKCWLARSCDGAAESALQFVMREMGNGVVRAESARVMHLLAVDAGQLCDCALIDPGAAPSILDLATSALAAIGNEALGFAVAPPLHGTARFLSDGVTEITLRIVNLL